ncbi:MAG: glycosyltransferase family 2 protein [Trichocoleus desertorum ATA4-8-CV12]|nr:glycosyltransferase family 2 protein [Trichocoleus desertorum ATA4-8-CV12]
MPKVSVIIPAYNAMDYLPQAVESVLRQTFASFEILIVDDGSSDEIKQWAAQIQTIEPRLQLITQTNQGVSAARNQGISLAKGEYIAFLDADDFWERTKLEKQVAHLENNASVGLVDTWIALTNEQGEPSGKVTISEAEGNVWRQIIQSNLLSCGSTPLVRRCCFDMAGEFDRSLRFGEDWDMWVRIAAHYTFAVVKEPLVFYRQHSKNTSKRFDEILPDLAKVVEKNFRHASPTDLYLKRKAYGRINLYIAWKAVESKDAQAAMHFARQALFYYPQLGFDKSYIRLILIVLGKRLLGDQGYKKLRESVLSFRQKFPISSGLRSELD